MDKVRVIELFAGVGGFRIGLDRADSDFFTTVWANQWEPATKVQHAAMVYEKNFGPGSVVNKDINEVRVEGILPAIRKTRLSGKKKNRLLDITQTFNDAKLDKPFENSGVMFGGMAYSASTTPDYGTPPTTISDIMVSPDEIPAEFYVPDGQVERWKYFKGAKRELRTRKDGGRYFYTEGGMDFPDSIDKPSRTIITSEGGKSPDRCRHVIQDRTGRLRRLVPVELERLNMFPDDHTRLDGVDDAKRAFLMGNALVCGIVTRVGEELKARLKSNSRAFRSRVLSCMSTRSAWL